MKVRSGRKEKNWGSGQSVVMVRLLKGAAGEEGEVRGRVSTWAAVPWSAGAAAVTGAARPLTWRKKTCPCLVSRKQAQTFASLLSRAVVYLKEITNKWTFFVLFVWLFSLLLLFKLKKKKKIKKDNHPAVFMTQKHQLKTIPCITWYFMLGWTLSACIETPYMN